MDLGPGRINNTSLGAANSLMTRRVSSVIGDDKLNFTKALPCAIHSFGFRFNPILFSLSLLLATICASIVTAQQTGQLPKQQFYNTAVFRQYYLADYNDSGNLFNRAYKTAYQRGNRRHLDSVCFLTMMGECHYHLGNYAQAMKMYDNALSIYLSYQAETWQRRLQLPTTIGRNTTAYTNARITWGTSGRKAAIANVPGTFSMLFGRLDAVLAYQQGGAVDNPEIYKVNVDEIMRCTALCLHRRSVIMGPTCKFAPFTSSLVAGLTVVGAGNGSIMGAYNGVSGSHRLRWKTTIAPRRHLIVRCK